MSWQHWTLLVIEILSTIVLVAANIVKKDGGGILTAIFGLGLFAVLLVWGQNG